MRLGESEISKPHVKKMPGLETAEALEGNFSSVFKTKVWFRNIHLIGKMKFRCFSASISF